MQANDLLEYRNKIIDAFKYGTFSSEYLKKSDDASHDYVVKDVYNSIQKIKSMSEKINLSLFEDFFWSSSPADYAEGLLNIKNSDKNKEIVGKIGDRISNLKDNKKKWGKQKKI